jgi:predicted SAM-dependent methyltransferase
MTDSLSLNLGCSDDIQQGFVNVDLFPPVQYSYDPWSKTVVAQADLRYKWPWDDSSVDFILAKDIIEHLPDKIFTMNEVWRVLKPGGTIYIEVPTTDGMGAFQDPTHVSYWNKNSFLYYEKGNIYRERFCEAYGIKAAFNTLARVIKDTSDGPKLVTQLEAIK